MKTQLLIEVPGEPQSWQRAGGTAVRYTEAESKAFKERVYLLAMAQRQVWAVHHGRGLWPLDQRYRVHVTYYPGDNRGRDCDRVLNNVLDAFKGCLYLDDRQVDDERIVRVWPATSTPRIVITVEAYEDPHAPKVKRPAARAPKPKSPKPAPLRSHAWRMNRASVPKRGATP